MALPSFKSIWTMCPEFCEAIRIPRTLDDSSVRDFQILRTVRPSAMTITEAVMTLHAVATEIAIMTIMKATSPQRRPITAPIAPPQKASANIPKIDPTAHRLARLNLCR
jgi:hypothetical protein